MSDREKFLARVRDAVREGNRAGVPPLPDRPATLGYQGGGPDPVARLRDELTAAGGTFHLVATEDEARERVLQLVRGLGAKRVLLGSGLAWLRVETGLLAAGLHVDTTDALAAAREAFFAADVGISGVDRVVAETGTIALHTRPEQPRALSLLPPVHIAVARRDQLLPDLFDLFASGSLPACLSLITGPSKTGDIELRLVTGVHGPGEVHLVFVN